MKFLQAIFCNNKACAISIFIFLSVLSLFIYNDYGVSWDEDSQIAIGESGYECMVNGNKEQYDAFSNKYYGVAFEVPLFIIGKDILGVEDPGNFFRVRHLFTNLFFCFSCAIFFLLLLRVIKDRLLSFVGVLFLVLSPVIFGHSFINSKDVPFLSMTIISMYLYVLATDKQKLWIYILLGISLGLLINIRIPGIILVAIVSILFLVDFIQGKGQRGIIFRNGAVVVAVCCITLYVTWPLLWSHPIYNFIWAFNMMKNHIWDGTTLYFGELIKGSEVPWHYAFVWMGISTPILYLLLFLTGLIPAFRILIRKANIRKLDATSRHILLSLGVFLGPLIAVILFDSNLYDGWRQLYFIYAGFLIVAIFGLKFILDDLIKNVRFKSMVYAIVFMDLFYITSVTVQLHPFEHVYFNRLVSHDQESLRYSFEQDYWATSYIEAYRFIATQNNQPVIVAQPVPHPFSNKFLLDPADRAKIIPTHSDTNARYFVSNYRQHPHLYPFSREVFSISRNNSRILSVFELEQ